MCEREHAKEALGSVIIVPPDSSWPAHFQQERERLRPVLGPIVEKLQHYGSTAIPGLYAKPIIDMMAPVGSLQSADELSPKLALAGYVSIDAGFTKRRFFRRKLEIGELAYHLHLVVTAVWPVKNELLLRDWLIQHPEVAKAYEDLKLKSAAEYADDMPRYTESKSAFLRIAVNDARLCLGLPAEHNWVE